MAVVVVVVLHKGVKGKSVKFRFIESGIAHDKGAGNLVLTLALDNRILHLVLGHVVVTVLSRCGVQVSLLVHHLIEVVDRNRRKDLYI